MGITAYPTIAFTKKHSFYIFFQIWCVSGSSRSEHCIKNIKLFNVYVCVMELVEYMFQILHDFDKKTINASPQTI